MRVSAHAERRLRNLSLWRGDTCVDTARLRPDDVAQRITGLTEGRSNQAIGERLFLSPKTVDAYVRSVFTELGRQQGADDHRRVLAVWAFLRS